MSKAGENGLRNWTILHARQLNLLVVHPAPKMFAWYSRISVEKEVFGATAEVGLLPSTRHCGEYKENGFAEMIPFEKGAATSRSIYAPRAMAFAPGGGHA